MTEITLSCGTGEQLTADQVVLAPGPWLAAPAWRDLVTPLGVRVKKIVAMHLERPPVPGDEVIIFESEDAFLLPVHHRGHWLFSYACTRWDVDPDAVPRACPPPTWRKHGTACAVTRRAWRLPAPPAGCAATPTARPGNRWSPRSAAAGSSSPGRQTDLVTGSPRPSRPRPSPCLPEGATDDHQLV